jgi:hypothetical protein
LRDAGPSQKNFHPSNSNWKQDKKHKREKRKLSTDSWPNFAQRANPSSPVIERNYIQFFDNSRKNTKMTVSFFEVTFAPSSRLLGRSVASYCSP